MLYKPGYKTSEFWLALSQQILALLVVAGYLSTEQADNLEIGRASCRERV